MSFLLITHFPELVQLGANQYDLDRWVIGLQRRRFVVKVGEYQTAEELGVAVENSGGYLSDWARALLRKEVTISAPQTLRIVFCTAEELGCTELWTPLGDIHARGVGCGYGLVPPDLAFSLRIQLLTQAENQTIFMAMKALRRSDERLSLLQVDCDSQGRRFVQCSDGSPERRYRLDSWFAFVDPRATN